MKPTSRSRNKIRNRQSRPEEKDIQEMLKSLVKMTDANEVLTELHDSLLVELASSYKKNKLYQIGINDLTKRNEEIKEALIESKNGLSIEKLKSKVLKVEVSKQLVKVEDLSTENDLLQNEITRISDIGYKIHQEVEASQDREIKRIHILVDKLENEVTKALEQRDNTLNLLTKRNIKGIRESKKAEVLWDLIFKEKKDIVISMEKE